MLNMVNPMLSKKFVTFVVDMVVQVIVFILIQLDPSLEAQAQALGKLLHEISITVILAFMVQDAAKEMAKRSVVTHNQNLSGE